MRINYYSSRDLIITSIGDSRNFTVESGRLDIQVAASELKLFRHPVNRGQWALRVKNEYIKLSELEFNGITEFLAEEMNLKAC
ncbi:MAG: hypothetical protein OQK77_07670 [Psychromonas sp.]|nr:hypothetical protein [Psychromonas sp.]